MGTPLCPWGACFNDWLFSMQKNSFSFQDETSSSVISWTAYDPVLLPEGLHLWQAASASLHKNHWLLPSAVAWEPIPSPSHRSPFSLSGQLIQEEIMGNMVKYCAEVPVNYFHYSSHIDRKCHVTVEGDQVNLPWFPSNKSVLAFPITYFICFVIVSWKTVLLSKGLELY